MPPREILFYTNQLTERGTEVALYDYAVNSASFLGLKPSVIYPSSSNHNNSRVIQKFQKFFGSSLIPISSPSQLDSEVLKYSNPYLYVINDGSFFEFPDSCTPLQHSAFANKPKNNSHFAFVSPWLSSFSKRRFLLHYLLHSSRYNSVNHIVKDLGPPSSAIRIEKYRNNLSIPSDAFVVGRYGGLYSFDVPFVRRAILKSLQLRTNLHYVFINTAPFASHPRIHYLPTITSDYEKALFLDSINLFLHARLRGETFGLAVMESLSRGKPVMSYAKSRERNHLMYLSQTTPELLYNSYKELLHILLSINNLDYAHLDCTHITSQFSVSQVMPQFKRVFIDASN